MAKETKDFDITSTLKFIQGFEAEHGCIFENDQEVEKPKFNPAKYVSKIPHDFVFENEIGYYKWNCKVWDPLEDIQMTHLVMDYGPKIFKSSQISEIQKLLTKRIMLHPRRMDEDKKHVCLKNGVMNIETGDFKKHSKEFYISHHMNVNYKPGSKCEAWLKFLSEVLVTDNGATDQALIDVLQEFFGYSLTPFTKFDKALLLKGEGRNGKTKIINIWQRMLGNGYYSNVTISQLNEEFRRIDIRGKLVNFSSETAIESLLEDSYFKAVVSGDKIDGCRKYHQSIAFNPFCKLVFAMNDLPKSRDKTLALYERFLIVPLKRRFMDVNEIGYDMENPLIGVKDKDLEKNLALELDGIFIWALEGLGRLFGNNKFTKAISSDSELDEYKNSNNPIIPFLVDNYEECPGQSVEKDSMYDDYKEYCSKNGFKPFSAPNLFKEVYQHFPYCKSVRIGHRSSRTWIISGIHKI